MTKDSFQILADELTLIRGEIDRLQRTSLDKDEAERLHKIVSEKADQMLKMGPLFEQAVDRKLSRSMVEISENAARAAQSAAEGAVTHSHGQAAKAAETLLQDARKARMLALRQSGGFWGWSVSIGALGAVLGILGAWLIQGHTDARAFGEYPNIFCTSAGGYKITTSDDVEYCAVPL